MAGSGWPCVQPRRTGGPSLPRRSRLPLFPSRARRRRSGRLPSRPDRLPPALGTNPERRAPAAVSVGGRNVDRRLNGYFVATGQFDTLRQLWYSIADQHLIQLKARYAKIVNDDSGVGTRFTAAMHMVLSLTSHDSGVIDGDHLHHWLVRYVDPTRPVVMPFIWTATNLTYQSPEFFYLVPTALQAGERERAITAIRLTVGPTAVAKDRLWQRARSRIRGVWRDAAPHSRGRPARCLFGDIRQAHDPERQLTAGASVCRHAL